MATLQMAMLAFVVVTSHHGVDRNGFLLGTDFLSFWTVGRMLHDGADVYNQAAHIAAQQAYFTQSDSFTAFFYPPTFLPFCWPLGWLPYFPALVLWLLGTGAFFAWAVVQWLRARTVPTPVSLLFAAYPAVVIQITHGQTAFLVAGLLLLATLWVRERPLVSGVLFGLATIKPQFGLLIPLVLIVTGEWKVIAAAALTALALASLSTLAFGTAIWSEWFSLTQAAQTAMDAGTVGYAKMVSLFAGLMLIGIPAQVSYFLQGFVSVALALMLGLVGWRRTFTIELGALMLVGAVLVTPFVLDYDLLLLVPGMIVITASGLAGGFRKGEKFAVFLAFAAPAFARPLGMNFNLPIVPVIAFVLFYVLWKRMRVNAALEKSRNEGQVYG